MQYATEGQCEQDTKWQSYSGSKAAESSLYQKTAVTQDPFDGLLSDQNTHVWDQITYKISTRLYKHSELQVLGLSANGITALALTSLTPKEQLPGLHHQMDNDTSVRLVYGKGCRPSHLGALQQAAHHGWVTDTILHV